MFRASNPNQSELMFFFSPKEVVHHFLNRTFLGTFQKDVEEKETKKPPSEAGSQKDSHELSRMQAEHRKELLLIQEQLLRERLLRRMQEKKVRLTLTTSLRTPRPRFLIRWFHLRTIIFIQTWFTDFFTVAVRGKSLK